MKKIFFGILAIVAMVATSCQQEMDLGVNGGDTATITFEIGTPQMRSYSDGTKANLLKYVVYTGANDETILREISKTDGIAFDGNDKLSLELAINKHYTILFWAQNKDVDYYTLDAVAKTITVTYNGDCNDDNRDAFYGVLSHTVTGATTLGVQLKRPFAQLNVGAGDFEAARKAGLVPAESKLVVKGVCNTLNLLSGAADGSVEATFATADIDKTEAFPVSGYDYLAMSYVLVGKDESAHDVTYTITAEDTTVIEREIGAAPLRANYRTNIYGKLLTSTTDVNVEILPGFEGTENIEIKTVGSAQGLQDAIEDLNNSPTGSEGETVTIQLTDDINLNDLFAGLLSRAGENDPSLTIKNGKELTLDLGGKTLSATSSQTGKNYNMFDVQGTLTVINGTIEYEHLGENMGWGHSTNIFNVTAGGVLNLESVTATNKGGSDMGFVAHLNNWGEVTLNVGNSTLESNYVPVRVFNSGPDMNNVTIKNSTLTGVSAAFWVHNYTVADFGTEAKVEAQKALLNLAIYNQGNTFSPDVNGIRYGFTNSIRTDARGITKVVSEDGTEVTLGYFFDDNNGLIRRGVAGAEENTTIKKVVVEEGIATLYDRTFRRFYALEEVVLPSTLTTIGAAGSGVFQSCTNLKSIVIPESVTVLGKGTFQECSSLESINIPAGVTRIEADALRATGLVEVEFHEGVTYFGAQAFRDCKQLTKVVIKAPEFTMEGNTFGIMAAPFTPLTIEVANDEMKAYVESKLTDHAKTYITVEGPEPYYKEGNTYHINTAAGLVEVAALTINGGENIVLEADIDLAGVEFNGLNAFNPETPNTFDGQGHTVSNWTYTGKADDMGFIKNWVGPIKNLTVKNAVLRTGGRSAVIAAKPYGNIENCHVVDCNLSANYWACGLIAGMHNSGNMKNCTATNSSITSTGGTAAITGVLNETAGVRTYEGCVVSGCTINNGGDDPYGGAAIVGLINIDNATIKFVNCAQSGNTFKGTAKDAFVGYNAGDNTPVTIE